MPLETANYISDLVPTNPLISDNIADGPSHFWLIKKAIQNTFPNIKGAITASQDQLNTITGLVGSSTSDGLDIQGSLTVSDGVDLKGNLTVEGTTLVPSVTDWTKQQALGASDAEGRYIRSPNVPANDYRVLTISRNRASGGIFVAAEDGSNTQLQPAGDYATNQALQAEASSRSSADTDLQNQINNRVLKTGDRIDWLQVSGSTWVFGNQSGVYNGVVNKWVNTYVDNGGAATWDLNDGSPSNSTGNINWFRLYADGTLRTGKDAVAFQSDLGNYVSQSQYSNDFSTSDSRVINLAWGHRIQAFETGQVNGGDWVTFPQSFSGRPQAIIVTPSKYIDVSNNIATYNWSSTGFNIEVVHQSDITFSVIAIGPK